MDDQRESMEKAGEYAHKISFLAGWVAMLEDVEGLRDEAERGTGSQSEDTRDRCRYGPLISVKTA